MLIYLFLKVWKDYTMFEIIIEAIIGKNASELGQENGIQDILASLPVGCSGLLTL